MADTTEFFNKFLLENLEAQPSLKEIGSSFLFNIEGAGTWTLDLGAGTVSEGGDTADCTITCGKDDWESMLDNPSMAMQLFMMGKLKADNLGLATRLQQILG